MAEQATTVMLVNGQPNVKIYLKPFKQPVEGAATEHISLVLKPGANRLSAELLKDADIVKQMREDVERGRVYPLVKSIDKLRPDEALTLIELTGDLEILREWEKIDTREPVRDAIRTQLTAITGLAN